MKLKQFISIFNNQMLKYLGNKIHIPMYSRLSNKRRVWNNHIGWTFFSRKINVWYGITVLGGKPQKINKRLYDGIIGCKLCTNFCVKILYL